MNENLETLIKNDFTGYYEGIKRKEEILNKISKEPKQGNRRFPTTIETKIKENGEFIMNSIDLLKKGQMNYIVYGYLQEHSNFDEDTKHIYRKIYIKEINNTKIAKECRGVSRNTVTKAITRLEELGLLSEKIYEDKFGKYRRLNNLDGQYILLDFDKKPIQKLITCIKGEGVALFLILKKYCNIYGKCTLTQEQLLEMLGYNKKKDGNRKTLNLFLGVLEDIGCITVEKTITDEGYNKNISYCLV